MATQLNHVSLAFVLSAALFLPEAASAEGLEISGMDLLSTTQIATGTRYGGNLVFGLSGIDYDRASNTFISQRDNFLASAGNSGNPVAFTLQPVFTGGRPGYGLQITGVNTLGGAAGLSSLESIRNDPHGDGVWLASEGPNTLYHVSADGSRAQLNLPSSVAGRTPPGMSNYGIEGMSFTPNGNLWVSREDPMSGDGAGLIRLSSVGRDGSLLRQYVYELDNVSANNRGGAIIANPPGSGVGNNGVSEILAINETQFLVMERGWDGIGASSGSLGVSHNYIRIYGVDLASGTDVRGTSNLDANASFAKLSKTLLFDSQSRAIAGALNTYDTKIDNVEGMSFGPTLEDGRRSLVLVSDNNNSESQRKTQFVVLGLNPAVAAVPEPSTWALMICGMGIIGAVKRPKPRQSTAAPFWRRSQSV